MSHEFAHDFPGRYVRIEGPDGAGKTKQLTLAQEFSEAHGIDVAFIREPGGTELGAEIRHMLLTNKAHELSPKTEALLFTADRNHLVESVILPRLQAGKLTIGDRGKESMDIYQVAGGADKQMLRDASAMFLPSWYLEPDAVALLSIPKATREKRMANRIKTEAADKIESRSEEYYNAVFDGYKALEDEPYVTVVDAERTPEEVFEDMKPILFGKFLPRDRNKTIIP